MLFKVKGMISMICGYLRVSTLKQKEEGVSLEAQMSMIVDYALRFEIVKKRKK